jgi:hypothetical protein
MNNLPRLLLKAPRIFYAFAVLHAVYNVVEPLMQLHSVGIYSGSSSLPAGNDDLMRYAYVRLIGNAIFQSLFLVGFGVLADLLIAIWHNTRPRDGEEGE